MLKRKFRSIERAFEQTINQRRFSIIEQLSFQNKLIYLNWHKLPTKLVQPKNFQPHRLHANATFALASKRKENEENLAVFANFNSRLTLYEERKEDGIFHEISIRNKGFFHSSSTVQRKSWGRGRERETPATRALCPIFRRNPSKAKPFRFPCAKRAANSNRG